eukprot:5401687-Amphidinium_carterae.1
MAPPLDGSTNLTNVHMLCVVQQGPPPAIEPVRESIQLEPPLYPFVPAVPTAAVVEEEVQNCTKQQRIWDDGLVLGPIQRVAADKGKGKENIKRRAIGKEMAIQRRRKCHAVSSLQMKVVSNCSFFHPHIGREEGRCYDCGAKSRTLKDCDRPRPAQHGDKKHEEFTVQFQQQKQRGPPKAPKGGEAQATRSG